jgi:hypothetical protein
MADPILRRGPAYRVCELAKLGPFGRSKLHELIRAGRLPARKCGHSTIVLADDFEEFLKNLPERKIYRTKSKTEQR